MFKDFEVLQMNLSISIMNTERYMNSDQTVSISSGKNNRKSEAGTKTKEGRDFFGLYYCFLGKFEGSDITVYKVRESHGAGDQGFCCWKPLSVR